jgi:opacity protein-like surface antigen
MRIIFLVLLVCNSFFIFAQDDLLALVDKGDSNKKEYVTSAFKSSRVINNHSMEFIGKGVMDVRILHRFGTVDHGVSDLFGLDYANTRFGFDFGLSKNLTIGFGRSNLKRDYDGFIKFRPIRQATGGQGASPVSLVIVSGLTISAVSIPEPKPENTFVDRMSFFHELIVGRKFSEKFSLQLSPIFVHRNIVPPDEENNAFAMGLGTRLKITNRMAIVLDYDYIISGLDKDIYKNALGIGLDIETGGHVFQLHFSNSKGMNEKEFITNTIDSWGEGEIRFGFNLSRVFNIGKH